jgi:hypothetical protein
VETVDGSARSVAAVTPRQTIPGGYIEHVSPIRDERVDRTGYRFTCAECGWVAPIMRWRLGAVRHADEHECERA